MSTALPTWADQMTALQGVGSNLIAERAAAADLVAVVPRVDVEGISIAYEVVGEGRPWIVTPGGRYSKDYPGVRELAVALADQGNRVVIWDRPNCGESEVCFRGESESEMQADVLAGLLRALDLAPAVIVGGSGGARVSLLAADRHRDVAAGVAVWWISGGVFGLLSLASYYCAPSVPAAWNGGMEAVTALPSWEEPLERHPRNRELLLAQDPVEFIATMERWMAVYCGCAGELVPGLPDADARGLDLPTLVFRSGVSDPNHPRITSERLAALLPNSELVEPPWPDTEWIDRARGLWQGFERWPLLAPQLLEWAERTLP